MSDYDQPKTEENVTTTESNSPGNSKNGDSLVSNTKKKKKFVRDDGRKPKSFSQGKQTIHFKSDSTVNNIIININNRINTNNSDQEIKVDVGPEKEVKIVNSNEENKRNQIQQDTHAKNTRGFDELKMESTNSNTRDDAFKYNDGVLQAGQDKFAVRISRWLFSPECCFYYIFSLILFTVLTLMAFVDIFIKNNFLNNVWIFLIEIVLLFGVALDTGFRIQAMKYEYLSNIPLLSVDILLLIFLPVQIVRFTAQTETTVTDVLHLVFCLLGTFRFILVYVALKNTIKRQEDVRQNVEEIINFSDVLEENQKNYGNRNVRTLPKLAPSISFDDDESHKQGNKGFELIKEEEVKEKHFTE